MVCPSENLKIGPWISTNMANYRNNVGGPGSILSWSGPIVPMYPAQNGSSGPAVNANSNMTTFGIEGVTDGTSNTAIRGAFRYFVERVLLSWIAASPSHSCHLLVEAPKPEATESMHDHNADPASLPSGSPVLARYIQVLGGEPALSKVSTRVPKGNAVMPEGPPPRDRPLLPRSPDERVSVMHTPRGESVTAYNGQAGRFPSLAGQCARCRRGTIRRRSSMPRRSRNWLCLTSTYCSRTPRRWASPPDRPTPTSRALAGQGSG